MTDEQRIKDLVQRSQLNAGKEFTKGFSKKLTEELKSSPTVVTWSLGRIIGGFVFVTLVSGPLLFLSIRAVSRDVGGVMPGFLLPTIWSLVLTIGLYYVLHYTRQARRYG